MDFLVNQSLIGILFCQPLKILANWRQMGRGPEGETTVYEFSIPNRHYWLNNQIFQTKVYKVFSKNLYKIKILAFI